MSDAIDWMRPITVLPSAPLWGASGARTARYSIVGVRAEQLRRASILQKAAKGERVTKGNAAFVVERLARVVPGMRYKQGILIYSTLAPAHSEIFASAEDALPGRSVGRPKAWDAERRAGLVRWVEGRMAETGERTATASLLAFGDKLAAAGDFPPAIATLANYLARGRRERAAD